MRRTVHIMVANNFYEELENARRNFQKKSGLNRKVSITSYSEMAAKRGIIFPKFNKCEAGKRIIRRRKRCRLK